MIMAIEQPAYETVKRDGNFEVRRYNGYIRAIVEENGEMDAALEQGFRVLFNYITGGNKAWKKIPMTAPVTEEIGERKEHIPMTVPVTVDMAGESTYRIAFIMPGRYTLDTLPVPDDKGIRFEEVPDHNEAIVLFSGHSHEPRVKEKIGELAEWMRANGLAPKSSFRLARYDPPWIPGFLRHNEIWVDV